jgi:beta-lactamase regulating signal transducer with metallopeptidase domain
MISTIAITQWLKTLPIVERGGWTLLHSIWELAVVAGILGLALRMLGRASARIRYLAATFALALMFALPPVTFLIISKNPLPTPGLVTGSQFHAVGGADDQGPVESFGNELPESRASLRLHAHQIPPSEPAFLEGTFSPSWPARVAEHLSPAIPWLTLAWTLGVFALSFWNLGGWIATQRLRSIGIGPVNSELADRLSSLARMAGVTRPVRIVKSTLVQIPIVVGFVRPLILVPVSVLAGMPPDHLEAILVHELAHIRRHDYLVNLFQVLAETLLFYHPAIWWVSGQIREERENCCDDIAAEICGNRRLYAEALVCVEELRPPDATLAIAVTGQGGRMFNRIQRLIGLPQRPHQARMSSLTVVLISLALLFVPLGCSYMSTQQPPAGTALHIEALAPFGNHTQTGDFFESLAGLRTFDGLPFEIEGSVVFFGQAGATGLRSLPGIQVGQQFDELHLIHYVRYAADKEGTPVAVIRLNYSDGSNYDLPILYGSQIRTYVRTQLEENDQPTDSDSKVIWRSPVSEEETSCRLFETVLHNPFPAKTVKTLDVFPGTSRSCYSLVAATVAKSDPARTVTAAVPLIRPPTVTVQQVIEGLTIRVFDRTNMEPIADALIIASMYTGGSNEIAIPTDTAGIVHLKYPIDPDGELEVSILKDGYAMGHAKWSRDAVPAELNVNLEKGISIGGIVRSDLGKPVSGALIHLHLLAPNGDEYRPEFSTRTNGSGRWSISGMAADNHNFSFSVAHSTFVTATFLPNGAPDGDGTGRRVDLAALVSKTAVLQLIPVPQSAAAPAVPSS